PAADLCQCVSVRSPLDRPPVDFDPIHAGAGGACVACHQTAPADLVHFAEVRFFDPIALDDLVDVQLAPADVGDDELVLAPIARRAAVLVADQPGAIAQLQQNPRLAEPGLLGAPADLGRASEVDKGIFVPQGDGAVALAHAVPDVVRIVGGRLVMALLEAFLARSI